MTTTSKKTLPTAPVYPQLPSVDPTPVVHYPPAQPGFPARTPVAAQATAVVPTAVGPTFSNAGTISAGCIAPNQTAAVPSSSFQRRSTPSTSGRRPDSGLGTSESEYQSGMGGSDSENAAFQTCQESSDDSEASDSDEEMSASAPTDEEELDDAADADHGRDAGAHPGRQAGAELAAPQGQATPVDAAQPASVQPRQTPQLPQADVAGQQPQPGGSVARGGRNRDRAGRNRGNRGRGASRVRGHRQRRRKREWEESEEELSPVDDDASFPSRISPRNKKPFQGYTNF